MRVVKFFYLFSVACALAALTACGSNAAYEFHHHNVDIVSARERQSFG